MRVPASVLVASLCLVSCGDGKSMKYGEIASSKALKEKYGLSCASRLAVHLRAANVPPNLVELIPMAERWGTSDDVIRNDCNRLATAAEKQAFSNALRGKTQAVTSWLNTFKRDEPFTPERSAFMYMLSALDEMKIWPDLPPSPAK